MQESKQDEYLDIVLYSDETFDDKITKIRSLPNRVEDGAKFSSSYVKKAGFEMIFTTVFRFKFHNISSQMYMSCSIERNIKIYSFFWLSTDYTFNPDKYSPLSLNVMDFDNVYSSSLDNINTRDFEIPTLIIGDRKFNGMDVPVILGLSMLKYLGLNECNAIDVSHVTIPYTNTLGTTVYRRLYLLDQRSILGKGSVYEKYGFELEKKDSLIGEITLQDILDDYEVRIKDLRQFMEIIKEEDLDFWRYCSYGEDGTDFYLATELLKRIHSEENKNITIKEWLTKDDTNIKSIFLFSLINTTISWKSKNKNSIYYRETLKFQECYNNLGINEIYNPDIRTGLRKFLSK